MQPGLVRVLPAFDHDIPIAQLAFDGRIVGVPRLKVTVFTDADHRGPTVQTGVRADHRGAAHFTAAGAAYRHGGAGLGAAFDEYLGSHRECFPELHPSGEQAVVGGRGDIHDIDTTELFRCSAFDNGRRSLSDHLWYRGLGLGRTTFADRLLVGCRCCFAGVRGCALFYCHTADYRGVMLPKGIRCTLNPFFRWITSTIASGESFFVDNLRCFGHQVIHNTPKQTLRRPQPPKIAIIATLIWHPRLTSRKTCDNIFTKEMS